MTIEVILLFAISVFLILGSMWKDFGSQGFFPTSAPRLAARLERNLTTGDGFVDAAGVGVKWERPANAVDNGSLK